jgi:hypothetical protein
MADQKIELELVLDDGSVKRAFATVRKEAEDTGSAFGNAFAVKGLADFAAGINLTARAMSLLKDATIALFDVLSGERIDAINRRFEILAQQQNANAEALAFGIARAVGGTVDLEEALQATSRSLINLQTGVGQLPALFEVARKSAAAFGGDTISNFERIQQAVITGNTRALREVGLVVNAELAYQRLADSLGVTVKELTEAGKQQAILNEVLRFGEQNLKNITSSIEPVNQSIKRLGVSFGEVADTVAVASNKAFGPTLKGFLDNITAGLDSFNVRIKSAFGFETLSAAENVRLLADELARLEALRAQEARLANSAETVAALDIQIAKLREKLTVDQELAAEQEKKNQADLLDIQNTASKVALTNQLTQAQIEGRAALDEYTKLQVQAANQAKQSADQLNGAIKSALVNAIAQGVQAMAMALVKGENVLSAFGKTILGVFADLAIQTGTILIGIGIGLDALKALSGFAAVAAGIGLVAIGGVLKALSGGGGPSGTNEGVTATGGGVAFTGDTQTLIQQNQQEDLIRAPQTVVNFQVMGDILDSSDTQNRIVSLLNDAIDSKGAVVRGMA